MITCLVLVDKQCFWFQSCLVGIVVPDPDVIPKWAGKKGIVGTYQELCKNAVGGAQLDLLHRALCVACDVVSEERTTLSFLNRK